MEESIKGNRLESLLNFDGICDPRLDRKKLYPLDEILFLVISSVISGYTSWEEISDFGEEKIQWLKKYLPYKNGIASHDTLNRTMSMIDYRSFEEFFLTWMQSFQMDMKDRLINIDGKKLSSSVDRQLQQKPHKEGGKSAIHLVEAWCSEVGLCLGQYKTEDKSNEITAIPALLDMLELSGSIVSIDAMGCQKAIAEKVKSKQADYILGLKGNQGELLQSVVKAFESSTDKPYDTDEQIENGHGRTEVRECRILSAKVLGTEVLQEWAGLTTLIEVCSSRLVNVGEKHSVEVRYYIGSKIQSAKAYNTQIRGHWAIENQLHWTMDVLFGEDECRKRTKNAAQNFGIIRRIALNLLKNNTDKPKVSIPRKLKKCALSDVYRENTLNFNA